MKSGIYSILKYLFLLLVGLGLLWLAFRGVNIRSTLNELRETNMFWVLVSVVASLIAFTSRAHRWNMLIKTSGYTPGLYNTSIALMIGYLANLAIPRLGEVTRCGTLSKSGKIPFDLLIGTVIVERALDVVCLLICVVVTAFVTYERLGDFISVNLLGPAGNKISQLVYSPYFYIFLLILLISIVIWVVSKRKNVGSEKKKSFTDKIASMLTGILEGLRSIRKLESPGAFIFHTLLI
ncbi:MAG: flippase-like domain-containing protein, partial [Bacteroidia bacterium]|nr:flippase-like domain-containing protein [Bacteroidia bacterium]